MDSYGLLLFILWLVTATGIVLFTRWLSRFLSQFKLPNDTRLLILIAFTGVLVIAALNFLWKQGNRQPTPPVAVAEVTTDPQQPNTELNLETYESATYPELYGLRQDMLTQINALHAFFGKVGEWAEQMPAQRRFLQTIIDLRWARQQQLRKAYQDIDRSRREFWLHYRTGEDRHVRTMFDDEAQRLQKRIQDALGDSREFQLAETEAVREHLRDAETLLKAAKLPKPKKGQRLNTVFQPYSDQRRQTLFAELTERQETSITSNLTQLQHEETQIRTKLAYMVEYQKVNTDLLETTNDLILEWNKALIYNQYAQYRLLFATEALEISVLLGLTTDSRDYTWLLKQLRELAPDILAQAEEERRVAAYSYNPEVDHSNRQAR
ncbi:MAG: hypothetical protein BWK73_28555 [Thiothrix lacustris]|uniref:Uncharacterized protein n=1 Tax=Thiothrix lacustris TaxID=525917 RepID=A0A1Y1QJK1_9GAMM|nr:MAG: hypothetical protein BWK73_28555 [Thiothrix lacustris]